MHPACELGGEKRLTGVVDRHAGTDGRKGLRKNGPDARRAVAGGRFVDHVERRAEVPHEIRRRDAADTQHTVGVALHRL